MGDTKARTDADINLLGSHYLREGDHVFVQGPEATLHRVRCLFRWVREVRRWSIGYVSGKLCLESPDPDNTIRPPCDACDYSHRPEVGHVEK